MKMPKNWGSFVVVLAAFYLVFGGNRGLWNLYKLHQEKQNLTEQVGRLKSEIQHCQVEYQVFEKNTLVFEKLAREELDLVKPGEIVYKFSKADHP
jgi:cell division protein FtsB